MPTKQITRELVLVANMYCHLCLQAAGIHEAKLVCISEATSKKREVTNFCAMQRNSNHLFEPRQTTAYLQPTGKTEKTILAHVIKKKAVSSSVAFFHKSTIYCPKGHVSNIVKVPD